MAAVDIIAVVSTSYSHPITTVKIEFNVTIDNPPDQIGLLLVDQISGDIVDLSGNPYVWGSPPMPALAPLDLSSFLAGPHVHTFTINVGTLPNGVYDVMVFAWPDNNFDENYYIKELALDDEAIVCLMTGTLVATPDGERPVETLAPGDLVLTADGQAVPVRFVGVQHVSPRFTRDLDAIPIRLSAGSLGAGLPRRDLLVSPRHAVFVTGTLVEAGALVNGTTIRQERQPPEIVSYYSIETERHELLLAEGVPVESFLDVVPRKVWHNHADYMAAYSEEPRIEEMPYPRATSVRQWQLAVEHQAAAEACPKAA